MELYEKLTQARKAARLTQADVAAGLDVSRQAVSRWESGECNYTIDTLIDIADALGLSVQCPLKPDERIMSTEPENVKSDAANNTAFKTPDFSSSRLIRFPETPKKPTGGAHNGFKAV